MIGSYVQILIFLGAMFLLLKPLGTFIARVYEAEPTFLDPVLKPVERSIYWFAGVKPREEMEWHRYALCILLFNGANILLVFLLLRTQAFHPGNHQGIQGMSPSLAFNTAVSFMTNTGWQAYVPEAQVTHLSAAFAITVMNFMCAATGMSVMSALARAVKRSGSSTIGNFWVDMTRSTLYVLLPLALIVGAVMVWQGVPQSVGPNITVPVYEQPAASGPVNQTPQVLVVGPAASQVAVKQLTTSGGGYYGANSAHPLENPTPLSGFVQLLAITLIPGVLCYTFGRMVGDVRQGLALFAVMIILYCFFLPFTLVAEQGGNPHLGALAVNQSITDGSPGGNMEGKETRAGIVNSSMWALATTGTGNGAVNANHGALMPMSILALLWLMQLGEVVFGGIGTGVCTLVIFFMTTVFVCGLMVGRTPEYLGKKIDAFDVKMISLALLIQPMCVLLGTAVAVSVDAGRAGAFSPGPRGFSEILYAYTSAANTNGSMMGGLAADTGFYNTTLGIVMLCGRYWILIPLLALAGSIAAKRKAVISPGAVATHRPTFIVLTVMVVLVCSLIFIPALSLGPIADHLRLRDPVLTREVNHTETPGETPAGTASGTENAETAGGQAP